MNTRSAVGTHLMYGMRSCAMILILVAAGGVVPSDARIMSNFENAKRSAAAFVPFLGFPG